MRNILLLALFLSGNLIKGQDKIQLEGKIEITGNPCIDSICVPGLIWAAKTDTASFILTNWI